MAFYRRARIREQQAIMETFEVPKAATVVLNNISLINFFCIYNISYTNCMNLLWPCEYM